MTKRTTAIGVFDNRAQAQQAVQELKRLGFREDQIGVASRETAAGDAGKTAVAGGETYAEEGAVTGVAAGAGLGALWGIGIAAGLLPAIGPVIAGGTLAAIIASGAVGAAAAGLAGALIGLGIPEEEAKYYETEFHSGRAIVTVRADNRYDEAVAVLRRFGGYDQASRSEVQRASTTTTGTSHASSHATTGSTYAAGTQGAGKHTSSTSSSNVAQGATGKVQVREEELHVQKQPVQTGEVRVRKEVHTEHKTVQVPVTKEEVVIERTPVSGKQVSATDIKAGEEIRIPVKEEQVHVEKTPVVKEEVRVGKRTVQETEQVSGTIRKEEVKVEKTGDAKVRGDTKKK